jgi:hypothetical protein
MAISFCRISMEECPYLTAAVVQEPSHWAHFNFPHPPSAELFKASAASLLRALLPACSSNASRRDNQPQKWRSASVTRVNSLASLGWAIGSQVRI